MADKILSNNFPARPTNGLPFISSCSPGASPTKSKDAFGSPTPKTKLFLKPPREHF